MQTRLCKNCFNPLEPRHIFDLIKTNYNFCHRCYQQLTYRHRLTQVKGKYLYVPYLYEPFFKSMIHQFKSSKDNELGALFLNPLLPWIYLWFQADGLILAPSASLHVEERGFHHLVALFEGLKLPMYDCFFKTHPFKQAEQRSIDRSKIREFIQWNPTFDTMNKSKSYIVVDDVFTTGNTLETLVEILIKKGFKRIRLFALAATERKQQD